MSVCWQRSAAAPSASAGDAALVAAGTASGEGVVADGIQEGDGSG
jgi:hypothetical protein